MYLKFNKMHPHFFLFFFYCFGKNEGHMIAGNFKNKSYKIYYFPFQLEKLLGFKNVCHTRLQSSITSFAQLKKNKIIFQ